LAWKSGTICEHSGDFLVTIPSSLRGRACIFQDFEEIGRPCVKDVGVSLKEWSIDHEERDALRSSFRARGGQCRGVCGYGWLSRGIQYHRRPPLPFRGVRHLIGRPLGRIDRLQ
jgi:hypothetical protein